MEIGFHPSRMRPKVKLNRIRNHLEAAEKCDGTHNMSKLGAQHLARLPLGICPLAARVPGPIEVGHCDWRSSTAVGRTRTAAQGEAAFAIGTGDGLCSL